MAFPFGPAPTLGDFINMAVKEYGAELKTSNATVIGIDGKRANPRYLVREVNGKRLHATLPTDIADNEGLTPILIFSLCQRLEIPAATHYMGMRITEKGFEYDDPPTKH